MLNGKSRDQYSLDLSKDAQLERMIEARVALRAETDAIRWRFRLFLIESGMIATLVLAAGLAVGQPTGLVIRSAVVVGVGCLLSGAMLIGLASTTSRLLSRYRRWRGK